MENEKNELMIFDNEKSNIFTTLKCESETDKKKLYNALENCDVLLMDVINSELSIKDVYVQEIHKVVKNDKDEIQYNEKTGEVLIQTKYRTIIFDENGKTYATGAYGVINSLKRIFSIYGTPNNWTEPVKVKVVRKSTKNGKQSLSLILV